uniref:Uncharacterized protein n=1 Tax=Anguilla anguilla TaxID=7936 RepID=A0A0E9W1R0_ANGAN
MMGIDLCNLLFCHHQGAPQKKRNIPPPQSCHICCTCDLLNFFVIKMQQYTRTGNWPTPIFS